MPLRPLDFVVMVRQAHHAQRNILGLPKDQSNDRGRFGCGFTASCGIRKENRKLM